ncbi:ABC transporter substrate-binding protein [Brucella sp. NBRC 12950]|uniref:ABC transporter substrate-binding protein n=1 Tax=Brucella sp. NBRC 12950 TaxID=2994518 RepID=UPI0024A221AB|nr:ABC transporter substrate-binding protein [Brucella sp. NBRC 12950]GLU29977.1 ABC transporter substrate-binding protein [Brucella sp. NBRC 12950]
MKIYGQMVSAALVATALSSFAVNMAMSKTLVYCSEASPEMFDAAQTTSGAVYDASARNVSNGLIKIKRGSTELEPGLAESWEVSADGRQYTFHLRKGVKFHTTSFFTPSRDFNADDVIFTFERQGNKDNPYYNQGTWPQFGAYSFPTLIDKIEKIDDSTVKFILSRPEATFIPTLSLTFAVIQSKEYADKLVAENRIEEFSQQPVGTGPYQFVAYQKDSAIRYQANPDYWAGKQKIDNLIFAITPDAAVRHQKLNSGECHVIAAPNPADIAEMKKDPDIEMQSKEGLNLSFLAYNTQQKPFDDVRVRKALNMAVNKKAIIEAVYLGSAVPSVNPLPPSVWGYNKSVKDDAYDPEASRKQLEQAGVKDLKMKIWAMPVQRPYMPNARRAAELIQSDFAKVGVTAEIVTYDWGEYLKRSLEKDRDGAVMLGWTGGIADPDNFLAALLSCQAVGSANRANWCQEDFEKLIQSAKLTTDITKRTELYEQAQVVFKEQAPWLTIAHQIVEQPISKKVKNFRIDPFGGYLFEDVDIEE